METLLSALNVALAGTPALALAAALVWGVLSVVLSPCHLASIALIVGVIGGQAEARPRRVLALALVFAAGALAALALIGGLTAAAGRLLGDVGGWAVWVVAAVLLAVALHLLDLLPLPSLGPQLGRVPGRSLWTALGLGAVSGLALGPCTFAFMAPILAVVFTLAATRPLYVVALLLTYGLGHGAVIVLAGTSTGWVQRFLDQRAHARGTVWLRRVCGGLVLIGALYLLRQAP
jgi:cytochrome c-type biogenesis protein